MMPHRRDVKDFAELVQQTLWHGVGIRTPLDLCAARHEGETAFAAELATLKGALVAHIGQLGGLLDRIDELMPEKGDES
jgi:hypothetical protein